MVFCAPTFAVENDSPLEAPLPTGVVLREGEIWIPASETENIIVPREDANSDCGKTGHIPPRGYTYVGCKKGNTYADFISNSSAIISIIILGFAVLSALIDLGFRLDTSVIDGDYSIYVWTNGSKYWEHAVGYCTYTNTIGQNVTRYVNCEIREYRI